MLEINRKKYPMKIIFYRFDESSKCNHGKSKVILIWWPFFCCSFQNLSVRRHPFCFLVTVIMILHFILLFKFCWFDKQNRISCGWLRNTTLALAENINISLPQLCILLLPHFCVYTNGQNTNAIHNNNNNEHINNNKKG